MAGSNTKKTLDQTEKNNAAQKGDFDKNSSGNALLTRVLKNSSVLLSGNLVRTFTGLVSMGILIQSLGAAEFGVFVLIQTYAAFIGDFFTLQSWQVMTRHGAEAVAKGRMDTCSKILRFGFRLDLIACTAGTALAFSAVWCVAAWQNWPTNRVWLTSLYSLVILFRCTGMPICVFNLFDRHSIYSAHAAATGILRLTVLSVIAFTQPTLEVFVITELLLAILVQSVFAILAWAIIKQQGMSFSYHWFFFWKPSGLDKDFQKQFIWSALQSSLSGTILIASTHLVLLGVGGVMGMIAVAQFKVIQSIGQMLTRLASSILYATYPEFCKAVQRLDFDCLKKLIRSLDKAIAGCAVLIVIAFLLVGRFAIETCFGGDFVPVYWPMLLFLILSFLGVSNITVIPRLWAVECHRQAIWLQAIASFIHLSALVPLGIFFGLYGVVASFLVYYATYRILGNKFLNKRIHDLLSGKVTLVKAVSESPETTTSNDCSNNPMPKAA